MKKYHIVLVSQLDGVYRLKTVWPSWKFEGPTEEDVVAQAKAAYLEYYKQHPEEALETKMVEFWIDMPGATDANDATDAG